ncbi:MAG TPA: hypothetical protein VEZ47_02820, partial [Gemmatirosa sp.]|nr:hypothetical protein [Gemmatirosa sp.]
EHAVAHFATSPDVALTFSGTEIMGGPRDGEYLAPRVPDGPPAAMLASALREVPGYHATVVMHRDAFDAVGRYREAGPTIWAEDYDLFLRLAVRYRFAATHEVTVRYRVHGGQLSTQPWRQNVSAYAARALLHAGLGATDPELQAFVRHECIATWQRDLVTAWQALDVDGMRATWTLREWLPAPPRLTLLAAWGFMWGATGVRAAVRSVRSVRPKRRGLREGVLATS